MEQSPGVNILGVKVDKITLLDALRQVETYLKEDSLHLVVTANPEIIMRAGDDSQFAEILAQANLVTADGIGLIIGAKLLGQPLPERVTGVDLSTGLFQRAVTTGWKIYLLGAAPGVAKEAANNLRTQYRGLQIVGYHDGYFQDSEPVVAEINALKPDVLLVALGMGKQEKWIWENRDRLPVRVAIGVGGSLDVYAGRVKRAPELFQRLGLEWFYRLLKQPTRLGRMLKLPVFLLKVLKTAISRRNRTI